MRKLEKSPSYVQQKTPRRTDFPEIQPFQSRVPSHRSYRHSDVDVEIIVHPESEEDIIQRRRYWEGEEEKNRGNDYIIPIHRLSSSQENASQNDKQPLYFHPMAHASAGLLSVASAYGRGLVSTARFYMAWQLFNIMLGRKLVEFSVPASFATASFLIAPLLAVDWGVNGYHSSLMLSHAYKKERGKTPSQNPIGVVVNVLRQNTLAIFLGLIGAIGHSFVVHHSILELEKSYGERSAIAPVFDILRWFFPVVCGLQYLSTEVPHTAESLKRPFMFEDYSEGMLLKDNGEYRKMRRVERWWRIASMNSAAVVMSLAWGALECSETYLTLRRHLHRNGVALSAEIALLIGLFFGLLGAYNAFISDGERFKSFVTYPYRDLLKKEKEEKEEKDEEKKEDEQEGLRLINLKHRKIPHFSRIPYLSRLSLKLLSTGLLSVTSSGGLGVVSATGLLQIINVFVQFYNPEKPLYAPWWLMTIAGGIGITTASVFWISKGRYIYSPWRHHKAKKLLWNKEEWENKHTKYQDHRETKHDKKKDAEQRNPLEEAKTYYDIHHGALDVLQIGSIFVLKLFVELQWDLRLPFLTEISTVYLAALAFGLIFFGLEEAVSAKKPVDLNPAKDIKALRILTQCISQLIIPLAVGVISEWGLHGWVMNEPVSEASRLTFAHIGGTFIAAVSAVITKRVVDKLFSKPEKHLNWMFFKPPFHFIEQYPVIDWPPEYENSYHWRNFGPFHLFRKIKGLNEVRYMPIDGLDRPVPGFLHERAPNRIIHNHVRL